MHLLNDYSFFLRQHLISKTLMVLLSCFHSRYTALLFFHSAPQEVPRPHLTLSLLYPAKSLIQQLMEDNQCPSHLSLSSSLLLISSLKGDQLVHFFHDNIAEASLLHIFQILILQGNFLDGCAVECSLWKQSLGFFLWFCCCRHTVYSSVCPSGQPLSSCVRSWLLCVCLFTLTVTFGQLPCFQDNYLNLFPLIPIQSVSCFYRIS